MLLTLKEHTIHPKSIAKAKLTDLSTTLAQTPAFMVEANKFAWNKTYGANAPYGIELTLMNESLVFCSYSTYQEQQDDWLRVQQAEPFFGIVKGHAK